jgi:hypothetical protein
VAANSVEVAPHPTPCPCTREESQVAQEEGREGAVFHSPGVATTPVKGRRSIESVEGVRVFL